MTHMEANNEWCWSSGWVPVSRASYISTALQEETTLEKENILQEANTWSSWQEALCQQGDIWSQPPTCSHSPIPGNLQEYNYSGCCKEALEGRFRAGTKECILNENALLKSQLESANKSLAISETKRHRQVITSDQSGQSHRVTKVSKECRECRTGAGQATIYR